MGRILTERQPRQEAGGFSAAEEHQLLSGAGHTHVEQPPLLGLIADHIGYHRALAFVALPILLAIVLAGQVPDRRGTKRTDLAFGD